MDHGTEAYFLERTRFHRRLAVVVLLVSAVLASPFGINGLLPRPIRERVRVLVDRESVLFGFAGPEQHLERVTLDPSDESSSGARHPIAIRTIVIPETHRGGGERPTASPDAERFSQVVHRLPIGTGASTEDIMARAMMRAGSTPVFRSEELVIESLVKPEYPEEARALGIEGRVALMALIDTLGQVADVELVTGEAGGVLELAAESAVRQARFKPYRPGGVSRQVYAVFRFAFRLY